jgi:hypothetical protein
VDRRGENPSNVAVRAENDQPAAAPADSKPVRPTSSFASAARPSARPAVRRPRGASR